MKRQKLYSNVIREQNKKISRIPFLPAKDPEGSDKKVPRLKVCMCVHFDTVCASLLLYISPVHMGMLCLYCPFFKTCRKVEVKYK